MKRERGTGTVEPHGTRWRVRLRLPDGTRPSWYTDTEEEAEEMRPLLVAKARAKAKRVAHTAGGVGSVHRELVGQLVSEGWRSRGLREGMWRELGRPAELPPGRVVPDAWRFDRHDDGPVLSIAEVNVSHHPPASKWDAWVLWCADRGVRFKIVVIDRNGTRSVPFAWATGLP